MLNTNTLSSKLASLPSTEDFFEVAAGLADAYDTYFQSATAGAIPLTPGATVAAKSTFTSICNLSISIDVSTAATIITSAITAYWAALNAPASATFAGATAIAPPPGIAALPAALAGAFAANQVGKLSLADASDTVANVIHIASQGGVATIAMVPTIIV